MFCFVAVALYAAIPSFNLKDKSPQCPTIFCIHLSLDPPIISSTCSAPPPTPCQLSLVLRQQQEKKKCATLPIMAVGKDGSPEMAASLLMHFFGECLWWSLMWFSSLCFLPLQLCVLFCSLTAQCVQSNKLQSKQVIHIDHVKILSGPLWLSGVPCVNVESFLQQPVRLLHVIPAFPSAFTLPLSLSIKWNARNIYKFFHYYICDSPACLCSTARCSFHVPLVA